MRTRITKLFGIERPIIQGGADCARVAEMAASVSDAGGLGIISALAQPTAEALADEIKITREMTAKPFGVSLIYIPGTSQPDYEGYIHAIIGNGVQIVEMVGNAPAEYLLKLRNAGVKTIHKCSSVPEALEAQVIGYDAISLEGFECNGPPGSEKASNTLMFPHIVGELEAPLITAGDLTNGRSLVAAIALGAEGVTIGDSLLSTKNVQVNEVIRKAVYGMCKPAGGPVTFSCLGSVTCLNSSTAQQPRKLSREENVVLEYEEALSLFLATAADSKPGHPTQFYSDMEEENHDLPTVHELLDRVMLEAADTLRGLGYLVAV